MAYRSETKSAKLSFASKIEILGISTRSFASRFQLRYAQPFFKIMKLKLTTNWSLYPQGLSLKKEFI